MALEVKEDSDGRYLYVDCSRLSKLKGNLLCIFRLSIPYHKYIRWLWSVILAVQKHEAPSQ